MARTARTFNGSSVTALKIVGLVAVWAALFAPLVPQSFCDACDRGCCAEEGVDRDPSFAGPCGEPKDGCPLCAAGTGQCGTESAPLPCHCQLTPRQDQPLSFTPSPPHGEHATQLAILETDSLHVPHSLGRSREYAAASLAIPIRPARILFGVWRN